MLGKEGPRKPAYERRHLGRPGSPRGTALEMELEVREEESRGPEHMHGSGIPSDCKQSACAKHGHKEHGIRGAWRDEARGVRSKSSPNLEYRQIGMIRISSCQHCRAVALFGYGWRWVCRISWQKTSFWTAGVSMHRFTMSWASRRWYATASRFTYLKSIERGGAGARDRGVNIKPKHTA